MTATVAAAQRPATRSWFDDAACRGMDTAVFFPGRGEPTDEAEAICASCRVTEECLWFALGSGGSRRPERFGIWGGTSHRRRRNLHRSEPEAGP